jgi:SprT protein
LSKKAGLHEVLMQFVPEAAVEQLADWIVGYKIKVNITKSRYTKSGDYRAPGNGFGHRISINHDLNKYHFLITFVHEVAHLTSFVKYKNISPHGREWKYEFKGLMDPFLHTGIFPEDVLEALQNYIRNPAATSCSDVKLTKILSKYDGSESLFLEDLPESAVFSLKNGKKFIKGPRVKKLYRCREYTGKHEYLVHPLAEIAGYFPEQKMRS